MGTFDAIIEHVRGDSSNAFELFRVVEAMVGRDDVWCGTGRGRGIA